MKRQLSFAEIEGWGAAWKAGRTAEGMPQVALPSFPDRSFSILDYGAVPGGGEEHRGDQPRRRRLRRRRRRESGDPRRALAHRPDPDEK